MTTLHLRKSYIKNLFVTLALFIGWLFTSSTLYAFPQLGILPQDLALQGGIIYTTDGNGHTLNTPVYWVNPQTLMAQGGSPLSGYTWTLTTGSAFPPGTTVSPLTGIFQSNGSRLIDGSYSFSMTVSDGSTTAHATFSFSVTTNSSDPPAVVPFEQLNLSNFALASAQAGFGYGASLYADGGTPPYKNWSLVAGSGSLPPGLVIDSARGIVRGTPLSSAAGHSYNFQISVLDNTNTAALNNTNLFYTINVPLLVPPSAPLAYAATNVNSSGFTANWSSVNGATGYSLEVSTSSSFATKTTWNVGGVTNKNMGGLAANTIYYYRVRAYNSTGYSGYSSVISVKTSALVSPLAPTANAATKVWGSWFTGNWSSVSGATYYRLDVSTSSSFSTFVSGYQSLNVGNVISQTVSGLSASKAYYYRVRAYNGAGTSGSSNVISVTTSSITPAQMLSPSPGPPGSTFTSSTVTFSWTAGVSVTQYFLYLGNSLGVNDIYGVSQGLNHSVTVSNKIPTDGRTIYVRLWSEINGTWYYLDYTYKAFNVSAPNLTPYQPSGWSNKIVTTHTYGSTTDTSSLVATSPIYIDLAVINNGVSNITTGFQTNLYVDNLLRISFTTSSLSVNSWASYIGWSIGLLSHGSHTIKITTDSTNQVSESNESDNTYSKTISVN